MANATLWSKSFWKGAGERAVKTFAQVFSASLGVSIGADLIPAVGIEGVNWIGVASVSLLATIFSVFTSIGNADFTSGAPTSPSGEVSDL